MKVRWLVFIQRLNIDRRPRSAGHHVTYNLYVYIA